MGKPVDHFQRAEAEWENLTRHCADWSAECEPWKLTVAFYCCLHYLEAYLHLKREKGQSDIPAEFDKHYKRHEAIRRCPELAPIQNAYKSVQNMSAQHRYVPSFRADERILKHQLTNATRIRNLLRPKIKRLTGSQSQQR